jgi:hypothetical protein
MEGKMKILNQVESNRLRVCRRQILALAPAALLALPLLGCATTPDPVAADTLSSMQTVGVVVAIGDRLHLKGLGFTIFDSTNEFVSITDWGIDNFVQNEIESLLANRFTFNQVTYNKATFLPTEPGFFDTGAVNVENAVATLPKDVDAYIVVTRFDGADPHGRTVPSSGLVLFNTYNPLGDDRISVYAHYRITLVDAETGAVISQLAALNEGQDGTILNINIERPHREVPLELWADSAQEFTPEQREKVNTEMQSLLKDSLPYILQQMGLMT